MCIRDRADGARAGPNFAGWAAAGAGKRAAGRGAGAGATGGDVYKRQVYVSAYNKQLRTNSPNRLELEWDHEDEE